MATVLDLADVAAEQWGLVTTAQARSLGVSPQAVTRFTKQGALERTAHGVYRTTGTPPSPLNDLRAAWLGLDPARLARDRLRDPVPAVVSHRSAATIHELGDLEAPQFEFTCRKRKQTRRPDVRIHRGHIGAEDWTVVDGLPVTTVVQTVDDLAAAHVDGGHLASVVRDALTRHHVDDQQLTDVLRRHAHRYSTQLGDGEALISQLLQDAGISDTIERAVELAGVQWSGIADELPAHSVSGKELQLQLRQLSEQIADVQESMAPLVKLAAQTVDWPSFGAATAETIEALAEAMATMDPFTVSQAIGSAAAETEDVRAEAAAIVVGSSTIKAIRELAHAALSPAIQHLAEQHAEVAEVSRLARTVNEAISTPRTSIPEIERRARPKEE